MEDQKNVRLPKIKNWEVIDISVDDLLRNCLVAFNEIPNKRLKDSNFPNTYAIASAIEGYFKRQENQQ